MLTAPFLTVFVQILPHACEEVVDLVETRRKSAHGTIHVSLREALPSSAKSRTGLNVPQGLALSALFQLLSREASRLHEESELCVFLRGPGRDYGCELSLGRSLGRLRDVIPTAEAWVGKQHGEEGRDRARIGRLLHLEAKLTCEGHHEDKRDSREASWV